MDRIAKKLKGTLAAAERFMNPDRLSYIQLDWQTGRLILGSDRPNSHWVELAYESFQGKSPNGAQTFSFSLKTQEDIIKVYGYLNALEAGGHTALETERGYVRNNADTWLQTLRTQAQQAQEASEHKNYIYTKLQGKNN